MSIHPVIAAVAIVVAGMALPAWWMTSDYLANRARARKDKQDAAQRAEKRRNFKRQIYPALEVVPHPGCRKAPSIPAKLDLSEPLKSDTSALMVCQVMLDGEDVHGPFTSWLQDRTERPIRRLSDVESIARRYAHQEWLIKFVQPLQSMVYQRHADGQWNLVRVGTGMF
jgi:hypothetical protein